MNVDESRQPDAQRSAGRGPVDVSVIVPTCNRADRLARLIDDLIRQDTAGLRYEILVCDNDSTDSTRAMVERAVAASDLVRYLHEPKPGASHARNRGIAEARGAILAFIDDDVRPTPKWLRALWQAFERHPEVDCVGGRVEPRWPCEPPAWLTSRHWPPLALQIDRSAGAYFDRDHASACLVTANFACRAEVFAELGGFAPEYFRDEDREFNLRLWRAGKKGLYVDAAGAFAEVQPERLTRRYHRRWYPVTGASHGRLRYREIIDREGRLQDALPSGRSLFGAPGFLYRELAGHVARWTAFIIRLRFSDAFFEECRVRYLLAYLGTRWAAWLREGARRWSATPGRRRKASSHATV